MTSSPTIPRSATVIAGVDRSHIPVSQTRAISAFSSFAFSERKAGNDGDPVSSSPSNSTVIWQGGAPNCLKARQASRKVIIWPLSSEAPRATISSPCGPASSLGSNGGFRHRFNGSTGCPLYYHEDDLLGGLMYGVWVR